MVELLGPKHAGERLPHHVSCVGRELAGNYGGVKIISFGNAVGEGPVKSGAERLRVISRPESQPNSLRLTRSDREYVSGGCLRAGLGGIYRARVPVHHV